MSPNVEAIMATAHKLIAAGDVARLEILIRALAVLAVVALTGKPDEPAG